ncbi:DUF4238 domain-containing protein [Kordiimonas sp.]|uniref:DUF4238 domain-containing protein n=1 Tax=Kordiimonas sp. TaxID=1970157 RepID=UPI003A938EFF
MVLGKKRKHHFLPKTYLKNFSDKNGDIWTYRLEQANNPFRVRYEEAGHIRDYYAEPSLKDGIDHNRLEDHFSENVEAHWPSIVNLIERGADLSPTQVTNLISFVILQRVRVPALRDFVELSLANMVRLRTMELEASGELPPAPEVLRTNGRTDWEKISFAIDPHRSLLSLPHLATGMADVIDSLGFSILQNTTNLSFITTDNPVCYYTPSKKKQFRPYTISGIGTPLELLFPITRDLCLVGQSHLRRTFGSNGIFYIEIKTTKEVADINDTLSRFAYQFAYTNDHANAGVIQKHAHFAPVPCFSSNDLGHHFVEFSFGPRPNKPKWSPSV